MKKFVNQRLSEDKMRVVLGGDSVSESTQCSCTCPGEDCTKTTGLHSIATFNAATSNPEKKEMVDFNLFLGGKSLF